MFSRLGKRMKLEKLIGENKEKNNEMKQSKSDYHRKEI